jgi:hypothetical protein
MAFIVTIKMRHSTYNYAVCSSSTTIKSIMLSAILLSVVFLSVVLLAVIMLNIKFTKYCYDECHDMCRCADCRYAERH